MLNFYFYINKVFLNQFKLVSICTMMMIITASMVFAFSSFYICFTHYAHSTFLFVKKTFIFGFFYAKPCFNSFHKDKLILKSFLIPSTYYYGGTWYKLTHLFFSLIFLLYVLYCVKYWSIFLF